MKFLTILCTIAALSTVVLAGCGKQNKEEDTSINMDNLNLETKEEVTITTTPGADSSAESTLTNDTAATDTSADATAANDMLAIATAYMDGMTIMDDCPASVSEKRADVTYGTVVHETYDSKTTGLTRGVNVIVPANYSEDKKYPVLYLLHGIHGNEYVLLNDGNCKIVEIVGNMIADGVAEDMIVVLPDMFAKTDPAMASGFNAESIAAYDNFINDLVNDLMPFINEKYSTLTDRDNHAIAGFSLGGRETLYIGLTRPDLFGYVLAIAPAPGLTPGKDWALDHPGQLTEADAKITDMDNYPYVLMVCCGTKDTVVGAFPESYHNIFNTNGVKHLWYTVPEADHGAQAIRSGLNNFLPVLFKANK